MSIQKAKPLSLTQTEKQWKKAIRLIPTGAQTFSKTPNQYVNGVAPKMLAKGIGPNVWDLDNNHYIDYTLALGPVILGHQRKEVLKAANDCAQNQFVSSPLTPSFGIGIGGKIGEPDSLR